MTLAATSGAAIIGFNVRANAQAREASERDGIEIRYYNIIYDLVDDVKAAMSGLLSPERRETMLGNAEILEIFNISKVGKVAGCRVTDGVVQRGANVRLIRDNVVIHEGKLSTLKRFKDEVREVPAGQECGMAFENYEDMRVGDVIECYRVEEIARHAVRLVAPPQTVCRELERVLMAKRSAPGLGSLPAPASRRRTGPPRARRHPAARRGPRSGARRHGGHRPEVRMSPDLKVATAFVMPLGGKDADSWSRRLIATGNSCAAKSPIGSTCAMRRTSASASTPPSTRAIGSTRCSARPR